MLRLAVIGAASDIVEAADRRGHVRENHNIANHLPFSGQKWRKTAI